MFDLIISPLEYMFMQRGMAAAVLVGVVCALVGTYIVLRGMAFFGDALAHSILPGIAIGYVINGGAGGSLFWWGLVTAVLASLGIGSISKRAKLSEDTSIGIIFAGMFALGIALISTVGGFAVDLAHLLFGNVLGVTNQDLWLTGGLGGVVIILIVFFYKEFMVLSFDPVLASTLRLPVKMLEGMLRIMIAVTIVVSLQTVGIALMVAMLVTPAATAFLLTKRMHHMMLLSALFAVAAGIFGLYVSYYAGIPSGASVVLVSTLIFLVVFVGQSIKKKNG